MARPKFKYNVCLVQEACDGINVMSGGDICHKCLAKREAKNKPVVLKGNSYREMSKAQRIAAKAAREAANVG